MMILSPPADGVSRARTWASETSRTSVHPCPGVVRGSPPWKSPLRMASYQCLLDALRASTVVTSWIAGCNTKSDFYPKQNMKCFAYTEYPRGVKDRYIPAYFGFVLLVEVPGRYRYQTSVRIKAFRRQKDLRFDAPFSDRVLDAAYLDRGAASLPFSSHSMIGGSFQVASDTVMLSVEK